MGEGDMRLTITQIDKEFGPINYTVHGHILKPSPIWYEQNIVKLSIYGKKNILIHKKVAPYFQAALDELQRNGFEYLINTNDSGMGCYNPRLTKLIGGGYSSTPSRHAWGIAIDLNTEKYPYGTIKQQPQPLLDTMAKYGFAIVVRRDPMHFEWVGTDINPNPPTPKGDDNVPAILSTKQPVLEWRADGFYTGVNDYGDWDTWIVLSTDEYQQKSIVEVRETSTKYVTRVWTVNTQNKPTSKKIEYGVGDVRFHFLVKKGPAITIGVKQERR